MLLRALEIWPGLSSQQFAQGLGLTPRGRAQVAVLLRALQGVLQRRTPALMDALAPYGHGTPVGELWTIQQTPGRASAPEDEGFGWPFHPLRRTGQQAARQWCAVDQEVLPWP
jgi:hypothetical protein